jgi:hypothetical protein
MVRVGLCMWGQVFIFDIYVCGVRSCLNTFSVGPLTGWAWTIKGRGKIALRARKIALRARKMEAKDRWTT